jgi:hypothetical protein
MSLAGKKARLNNARSVKAMTNDVTPSYVAKIAAFACYSAPMQRQ